MKCIRAINPIWVLAAMLAVACLLSFASGCSSDIRGSGGMGEGGTRASIGHSFKDVDCTISAISARWCVYFWKVDVEYDNSEYGLSGRDTLVCRDGAEFKDARVGDHIAVRMSTDKDEDTGEILHRHLGKIVVSVTVTEFPYT